MGTLSDRQVRSARADRDGKERVLVDGDGLQLRVLPSGRRLWEYRYRFAAVRHKVGLGTYPETTLKSARERAFELAKLIDAGVDPKAQRQAEEAQRQAEALECTVADVFDDWMTHYVSVHRKRPDQVREFIESDVLPFIGKMKAKSVEKWHINAVVQRVVGRGSPVKAAHVLALTKQMFDHAAGKGLIAEHPAPDLHRKHFGIKFKPRDRHLKCGEISELMARLPGSGLPDRIQAALLLLLATGQRTGELRMASWGDVDLAGRLWTIPAEHSKNGKEHKVHLSDFAVRQFGRMAAASVGDLVMESTRKAGEPMDEKTLSKMVRDRQRSKPLKNRSGACDSLVLPGGDWTPHDLRRTAHSRMGDLKVAPYIAEKILNHTMPGVMAVYNQAEYLDERREALDRWGAYLDGLQSAVGGGG